MKHADEIREIRKTMALDKAYSICKKAGCLVNEDLFKENGSYCYYEWNHGKETEPYEIEIYIHKQDTLFPSLKCKLDGLLNYPEVSYRNLKTERIIFTFNPKSLLFKNGFDSEEQRKRVMDKISKCLTLQSNAAATESEAIAAALMAQNLMAKHDIRFTEFSESDNRESEEIIEVEIVMDKQWKFILAGIVSENYRCKDYARGGNVVVFIGHRTDAIICRRVFVYLYTVGNKLANKYVRQYRKEHKSSAGIYNSFVKGFCEGVYDELTKNCVALSLVIPNDVVIRYNSIPFNGRVKESSHLAEANNPLARRKGIDAGRETVRSQYVGDGE